MYKRQFQDATARVADFVRDRFSAVGDAFQVLGDFLQTVYDATIAPVFEIFQNLVGMAKDLITGNFDGISEKFQNIAGIIQDTVSSRVQAAMDAFKDIVAKMVAAVAGKLTDLVGKFSEIPGKIKSVFSNASRWLIDAGKDIVRGLITGISSMAGRIGDAFQSIMPNWMGGLIPGFALGGMLPAFAGGGYINRIPGIPDSVRDPVVGVNALGVPIARIEPREFVINREDTAKNFDLLRSINAGAEIAWQVVKPGRGGRVAPGGDLPGYAAGGVIGAMQSVVKRAFPMMTVTSTVRKGDRGYHGQGLAVDFSNGRGNTPQMLALAKAIAATYPNSLELIYDAPGFDQTIKNGKVVGQFGQFYTQAQAGPHHHHVHWAMSTAPTVDLGAGSMVTSSAGLTGAPALMPPMKWSEKGLTVNAVRAARAVALKFPEITMIGGYRPTDPYPDHPSGRALDIMTYKDLNLGDRVKDFLFGHPFHMQYALWRQAQWNSATDKKGMADRGSATQNHFDHVHAYFAASPRATGSETYPAVGLGGVSSLGETDVDGHGTSKTEASKGAVKEFQIDWGTASGLAGDWEKEENQRKKLRRFSAGVFDTGGILKPDNIAVNLSGRPERVLDPRLSVIFDRFVQQMPGFVEHMPGAAAAMEKLATLDWSTVGQEIVGAFQGEDFGFGETARLIGDDMAQRITDAVAFAGAQVRDALDGANMRAYLSNMSATEGVALADRVGGLVGVKGIQSTFGGVAKAWEGLQDAAVMQVDASDAIVQAEKNLLDARAQQAQIAADGAASAEDLAAAQKAATAAEQGLSQAMGVAKLAAQATGQAQIAMALEVAEVAIAGIKWIIDLADKIRKSYVEAYKALATGLETVAKWAELVHEYQQQVASLQQQLVRGMTEQVTAERDLRIATHDRMIKTAEAEIAVAKARKDLTDEVKRGAIIAQLKMMGLHEDWDSYLAYEAATAKGALEVWSDAAIAGLYRYESARAQAVKAELEGRLTQVKAEAALAKATTQNARTQVDLIKAQERLIQMSAKVAGVDLVEATASSQLGKLFAELAETNAGIEKHHLGRSAWKTNIRNRHYYEYEGRLKKRDSIQRSIAKVAQETGVQLPTGRRYNQMIDKMAEVQRYGGDPLDVLRSFSPGFAQAEEALRTQSAMKPIWDAQDKLVADNRQVEDFLAEVDLFEKTSPLEQSIKGLDYTIQSLDHNAEAWAKGNEEFRGDFMRAAQKNERAAEDLGVRWKMDDKIATPAARERIEKETTIYMDGNEMYTADQIDQLLAEVTAGTSAGYKIKSASEVTARRRRERI